MPEPKPRKIFGSRKLGKLFKMHDQSAHECYDEVNNNLLTHSSKTFRNVKSLSKLLDNEIKLLHQNNKILQDVIFEFNGRIIPPKDRLNTAVSECWKVLKRYKLLLFILSRHLK